MHSDLCTVVWGSGLQVELLQDSRANQGIDVAIPWLTYSTSVYGHQAAAALPDRGVRH